MSFRQLQWWDERKIISARQEGHRRLYAGSDVIAMMAIAELRRKGLSLQKSGEWCARFGAQIERKLDQLLSGESELYLVTDGKTSHFEHESARVIELLKNCRKPLVLVSMSDMAKRVAEFEATARGRNPDDQPKQQLKLF